MRPRTVLPSLALVLCLGSLASCDDDSDSSSNQLKGTFQTRGYGYTLVSDGQKATLYETTSISCMKVTDSAVVGMQLTDLGISVRTQGDTLIIESDDGIYFEADRVASLPKACENGGSKPTQDALANFDILATTFNEHYAFFQLHGIDWQTTTASHRARLSPASSRDELYNVICEMITPFRDGHVSLQDGTRGCSGEPPDSELQADLEAVGNYFGKVLTGAAGTTTDAKGAVAYRMLAPGVGYLMISQMYVDDAEDDQQTNIMGAAIDRATAFFGDVGHLIIDIRANSGGLDKVSLAIAGRFTDSARVAYTKMARHREGTTTARAVTVEPRGPKPYLGKVLLLTSGYTASAAETFTLMMRVNPAVTVIGEHTAGVFSDILGRQLPNGMLFGLSNEIYRAADGQIYEGLGVPPTIPVPATLADLAMGKDVVLETALALAGQ
jgi:carboxyl-terminal processing protease